MKSSKIALDSKEHSPTNPSTLNSLRKYLKTNQLTHRKTGSTQTQKVSVAKPNHAYIKSIDILKPDNKNSQNPPKVKRKNTIDKDDGINDSFDAMGVPNRLVIARYSSGIGTPIIPDKQARSHRKKTTNFNRYHNPTVNNQNCLALHKKGQQSITACPSPMLGTACTIDLNNPGVNNGYREICKNRTNQLLNERVKQKKKFRKLFESGAYDTRQKVLEMHLQSKATKDSMVNSQKSLTRNVEEMPKDQTIRDIVNNMGSGTPKIDDSLTTFDINNDQKSNFEKEIRLCESFSNDFEFTENDTNGSSSGQQMKQSSDTKGQLIKSNDSNHKMNELYDKSSLTPDKLKMMVAMFQLYAMFKSKNAFDFSTILSIWNSYQTK